MRTKSARDVKNAFGLIIDNARAEPSRIEKHGSGVFVVVSVEAYDRLSARPEGTASSAMSASHMKS